jgi:predicted TIM-barrel fold metal-dependent hydrolase
MIVDAHTHIFPKFMCERRSDYFEGEPAFKLLYESAKSKMADAETLLESMDQSGVDVSMVFGFPWKTIDTCRKHNDYILNAVSRHSRRLKGLCCVDMYAPGAVMEIERCLDAGLSGVGEIAFYQSGIGPDALELLRPVMDLCKAKDLPVLIHANEPIGHVYPGKTPVTLSQIYSVAETFPENKIILAHWGGGIFFYSLMKKEVRPTMKHVFFDTAASPFLYDPKIYRVAVETSGAEKILLGTDFPLIRPDRYFKEMEAAGLTENDKRLICGGNAEILFNL